MKIRIRHGVIDMDSQWRLSVIVILPDWLQRILSSKRHATLAYVIQNGEIPDDLNVD